ncbi:MAG: TolB family protein, partial [Caldilineaceae bacterium]
LGWASAAWLRHGGDPSTLPVSTATDDTPPVVEVTPVSLSSTGGTAAVVPTVNQAVALPAAATALVASESPLTGKLAFQQSPGGMIYLYDFATETLRPLTNGFDPAISPDGTQVAFVRDGGEAGLYLINSDGSNERRIFDERGSLSSPKWSPDGTAIVFARNDEYIECYQVGPRECLVESAALERVPSAMLDTLPFVKEYQYSLSVVDINGNNFHDLPALKSSRTPDWSAGGVVYQSSAGIQRTTDGADATTQVAFEPLGPTWQDPDVSPDGSRILYQVKGAAQWDLWVMNADGSGRTGLTRPATTLLETLPSNVAAAWSPDGSQIVFLSNRTDTNTAGAWRLWVMDADGSNQ